MNLEGKKVLVAGLAISGIAAIEAIAKMNGKITVTDMKTAEELSKVMEMLRGYDIEYVLGSNDVDLDGIDFILKSPGIPPDIELFKRAEEKGVDIVTDIELAYRIARGKLVCITGTNGKTTTTSLIGEIFSSAFDKVNVVGNIGVGILSRFDELLDPESVFVIEASSFQLENTVRFRPLVSLITNITPDHLNWHKTYDNYIEAKYKCFANQTADEYTVLNYDDEILRNIDKSRIASNLIYFSTQEKPEGGVYVEGGKVVSEIGGKRLEVMDAGSINIPGKHNLENVLSAVAVSLAYGIDKDAIAEAISRFQGVEHRLEFVAEAGGVKFYNDSKGTNVDASIKAIEAISGPINLIAGGKDKGSDFEDFIEAFSGKVDNLILLGETADKIEQTARSMGFERIHRVKDMAEAVRKAYELASAGHTVLLSPACASWDMYESYEIRGRDFKENVNSLGVF